MSKTSVTGTPDFDFLKSARDLVAIIAIYLYFSGWLYVYYYYYFFGLSIKQLDIDFYYFMVFSLNPILYLADHWYYTLPAVLICIAAVKIITRSWVIYVICVLLFICVYYSSKNAGLSAAKGDFCYHGSKLKKIQFVLKKADDEKSDIALKLTKDKQPALAEKPPKDSILNEFTERNKLRRFKLLAATKDDYFVIFADKRVTKDSVDDIPSQIYMIKKESIALIKFDN